MNPSRTQPADLRRAGTRLKILLHEHTWLVAMAAFLLAVILIAPWYETSFDEDFAYVYSVKGILANGGYHIHDWAAPNCRFLAYWAALFGTVVHSPFVAARISTIVLLAAGLLAFHALVRSLTGSRKAAVFGVLMLLACPMFLVRLTNSCTDGAFLGLSLVSLYCFDQGIRRKSLAYMLVGSVVTSCAILTRQAAVAIPVTLFILWMLSKGRRAKVWLFLAGMVAPVCAAAWVMVDPAPRGTLAWANLKLAQAAYLHSWTVVNQQPWRLAMTCLYLAIYVLPLTPVVLLVAVSHTKAVFSRKLRTRDDRLWVLSLTGGLVLILAGLVYQYRHYHSLVQPYLPWYWNWLYAGALTPWSVRAAVAPWIAIAGIALMAMLVFRSVRSLRMAGWSTSNPSLMLLIFSAVSLGELLSFYKIGDKYVVVLLPFSIVALWTMLKPWIRRHFAVVTLTLVLIILVQADFFGGRMRLMTAEWNEAETLRRGGVPLADIGADWQWINYNRYDDFVRTARAKNWVADVSDPYWKVWLPEQYAAAKYLVWNRQTRDLIVPGAPAGSVILKCTPHYDSVAWYATALVKRGTLFRPEVCLVKQR